MQAAERLQAGRKWQDNDLVFTTATGTPLDRHNVLRAFRFLLKRAGIKDWQNRVPYEMRHTYASLVADSGISAEEGGVRNPV